MYALIAGVLQARLTTFLSASLLIGYCGGPFYSQGMALLGGVDLLTYVELDPEWMAYALMLVLLASIVLLLASSLEKPLIQDRHRVEVSRQQERFLWTCLAVLVVAYATGLLSYGGVAVGNTGRVSVIGVILFLLVQVLPAIAAIGYVQSSGARRLRFGVLTLAALAATIPQGRRIFGYGVILMVFAAARFSERKWNISAAKKVMLIFGAALAIFVSSVFFYALRLATGHMGIGRHSIAAIVDVAESTTLTDPRQVIRQMGQNANDRTSFLIEYLAMLARGGNSAPPLYGADASLALHVVIPDAFYGYVGVDKTPYRDVVEENLANEHFGMELKDMANSILTGGFIDFGIAGLLIYPLLLCAVGRLLLTLIGALFDVEGQIMATLLLVNLLLETEKALQGISADLRNVLLLLVLWWAIYSLPEWLLLERRRSLRLFEQERPPRNSQAQL